MDGQGIYERFVCADCQHDVFRVLPVHVNDNGPKRCMTCDWVRRLPEHQQARAREIMAWNLGG